MPQIILKLNTPVQPSTWNDDFREITSKNKTFAQHWFWDNFNWKTQSLWIGKFNKMNNLPDSDEQINIFLKKLINDIDNNLKKIIYIKFYFSRNVSTGEPEINYLLICETPKLPKSFDNTLISVVFEKYQVTESIMSKNDNFKNLIDHYINWNNFYTYYDLLGELQY